MPRVDTKSLLTRDWYSLVLGRLSGTTRHFQMPRSQQKYKRRMGSRWILTTRVHNSRADPPMRHGLGDRIQAAVRL